MVLVTHHVEEIPQGFSHCLILSEGKSSIRPAARRADRREPVHGVRPVDRPGSHRRTLLRPPHPEPRGAQEAPRGMSDDPLVPAAGRDGDAGPRHRARHQGVPDAAALAMDFVAGVMVFPGGGVDDRDRNADIAWSGPEPAGGRERLGVDTDLAEALVCAAARETFEESGVLFAGPADDPTASSATRRSTASPRRAGRQDAVVRRVPAQREAGAARRPAAAVGELGDAEGGAHPPLRHLLLRRGVAGRSARRRREHRNRPRRLDHARGRPRRLRRGGNFLLPPTWTQLDSLAGRTVAEVLAVERQIVPVEPHLAADGHGNWEIEFFNSDRYNEARRPPARRRTSSSPSTSATSSPASARCCCRGRRPTR